MSEAKPFTQEELEQLKHDAFDRIYPPNQVPTVVFRVIDLKALLARLSAAEKVLGYYIEMDEDPNSYAGSEFARALDAWLKSCGRAK